MSGLQLAEIEKDICCTDNVDDDCETSDTESVSDTSCEDFKFEDACNAILVDEIVSDTDDKIFMITGSPGTGII